MEITSYQVLYNSLYCKYQKYSPVDVDLLPYGLNLFIKNVPREHLDAHYQAFTKSIKFKGENQYAIVCDDIYGPFWCRKYGIYVFKINPVPIYESIQKAIRETVGDISINNGKKIFTIFLPPKEGKYFHIDSYRNLIHDYFLPLNYTVEVIGSELSDLSVRLDVTLTNYC